MNWLPLRPRRVRGWVLLAWSIGVLLLLRAFACAPYHIPSASMEDTLRIGDYLLMEKLSYGALLPWAGDWRLPGLGELKRFDIVIFTRPEDGRDYVKRCIGLPGEQVQLRADSLFVDDRWVPEPQRPKAARQHPLSFGPIRVPPGEIFVLGDRRELSQDSRSFGTLPLSQLRGRAVLVYFSWDAEAGRPRWDRVLRRLR